MLKRTLAIFTLAACCFMNLQAIEAVSSNSVEINSDTTQQDNFLTFKKKKHKPKDSSSEADLIACGKKKHKKKHRSASSSEEILAGCKKCRDHHTA